MPAPIIPIALALAEFAPTLLRYFGVGAESASVAEKVADIARTVTGAATPEDALAAIKASSEAQERFRTAVMQNDTDLQRMYLDDRKDARGRDIEFIRAGRQNVRADVMVAIAFVAVIVICWLLAAKGVDANSAAGGFLIAVGGMFARNIGTAFDFEFGSSRSSSDKTAALEEMLKRKS